MKEIYVFFSIKLIVISFWLLVISYVFVGFVPESPFQKPISVKQNLITISPQGWAFFTRNPREAIDQIYIKSGEEWKYHTFTNSSLRNFFGIKRSARAQNVELAYLFSSLSNEEWVNCATVADECVKNKTIEVVEVENNSKLQTLCGELLIVRKEPVPWAWSQSMKIIDMPSNIVRINANCTK